jgi:putative SOS response-associated peptidase YedK
MSVERGEKEMEKVHGRPGQDASDEKRRGTAGARLSQGFCLSEVAESWDAQVIGEELSSARFSVRPGGGLAVVLGGGEGVAPRVERLKWGLVPFWTPLEDVEAGRRALWARAETLWQKASFRLSLQGQRCVVPISGWYARVSDGAAQRTLLLRPKNGGVWSAAALWDEWISPEGRAVRTVALVSTEPNARLAPLALRMPAILGEDEARAWLHARRLSERDAGKYLQPLPSRALTAYAVPAPRWREQDDETLATPLANSDAITERLGLNRAPSQIVLRRQVMRDWKSPDGQVFFKTRSFTREDSTRWHPIVDTHDGTVFCDCPDFRFRHARHEPSVHTPAHWCKHLSRAVHNCLKHGDLRLHAAH